MVGDDHERREPRREDEHRDPAAREGGRRGGHSPDARRVWTPWLVIPYTGTDDGRWRPIPDNTVFWASPHIWVESSDPLGNPVGGEPNFVHARVFNLGKAQARPTRVDVFWMEPSIGPGNMNWLGSTWVEIPYHKSKDVRCPVPWVPQFLGHECLIVHTSADIDDPIALPFQPRLDRHVGQRNVNVVAAVPGQPLHYRLKVYNVAATAARVTIAVRVEHVAIGRGASRTMAHRAIVDQVTSYRRRAARARGVGGEIVHDVAADGRLARSAPQIDSRLSDDAVIVPTRDGNSHFGQMLLAADRPARFGEVVDTRDTVTLHETRMNAFEERRLALQLTVPATARPGEFVVAHVMQSIEGLSGGGYTIVAEVTGR
jgi:hypothetical protein